MKNKKITYPWTTKEACFLTICLVIPSTIAGGITHYKFLPTFLAGFIGFEIAFFIMKLWRKRKKN